MLDDQQLRDYRRDGFVLVKGLIDPDEAARLRDEAHAVLGRMTEVVDPTWESAKVVAGDRPTSLRHCHDVQFHSAAFSPYLSDERFTSVASQVIDSPNVQLHHTKMFVKPPEQGSPFPMHQDYPFFPHATDKMGAAIFFLDGATEEKGCVRVVPGSYLQGPQEHVYEGGCHLPTDVWPIERSVPVPAEPGDVIFFSYLTVHASGLNTSNEARTTWLVQFRDPANQSLTSAHTESLGQGMMLAGIDPTARTLQPASEASGPSMGMGGGASMGGAPAPSMG